MAVNVKSVFLGSNAFTEQVRKQGGKEGGGGVMINIASVGAHRPRPGLVWYNASKGAVANVSSKPIPFFFHLTTAYRSRQAGERLYGRVVC